MRPTDPQIVLFIESLGGCMDEQGREIVAGKPLEAEVTGRPFRIATEWLPIDHGETTRPFAMQVKADGWLLAADMMSDSDDNGKWCNLHFEGDLAQFERDLVLVRLACPTEDTD